jgi:hypothetical protein
MLTSPACQKHDVGLRVDQGAAANIASGASPSMLDREVQRKDRCQHFTRESVAFPSEVSMSFFSAVNRFRGTVAVG